MDVLGKNLDREASIGLLGLHPQCQNPMITHLSFADDVLVFFDGAEHSLQAIIDTLSSFCDHFGLGIILSKFSLFLDCNNLTVTRTLSNRFGLKQGALPVRCLGLPLTSNKLRK